MSIFRFQSRGGLMNSPMVELEKMRNHMESIYNSLAGTVSSQIRKNLGVYPLVNLTEDDDNLYLDCELPGAVADKLEVSVKGDTLNLRGQVGAEEACAEANYHRKERESGTFRRTLTLPVKVEPDRIEAVFKNGLLTVTMPKAAEAKAHQISIKVS